MPLTVLFDLDETLLATHMDRFIPVYFRMLGQALSHLGSQEKVISQLQYAVDKMNANQDPGKTLQEVFAENFYPPLGTTEQACQSILHTFYQEEYPKIKPVTQVKPEASELIRWCQSEGMTIAIATNPLFPQIATRQRITWADLDPGDFALFTAYDDFHFTKPHLAYYAEVLGRLGWPEAPVVMIGDNLGHDLFPMDTIGAETFWIHDPHQGVKWQGGALSEVKPWLKQVMQNNPGRLSNQSEVNKAILQSTPAVIDTWLRFQPADASQPNQHPQKARVMALLAALTSIEETVYHPMIDQLRSGSPLELPVPGSYAKVEFSEDSLQDPQALFTHFLKVRKITLAQISGTFQDAKITQTMNGLVEWMANRDREQLRRCVNL